MLLIISNHPWILEVNVDKFEDFCSKKSTKFWMYEIVDKIDEQNVPLVLDGFINYKPQSAFLVSWNCHKVSLLPPSSKQDNKHKREECPSCLRSFWAFHYLQDLDFSCVACFGSCQCSQIFICLWSWYYFCALFVFIVILGKRIGLVWYKLLQLGWNRQFSFHSYWVQ